MCVCVYVSTGKTPASPYEYGSFGKCVCVCVFFGVFVYVWVLKSDLIKFFPPSRQLQHAQLRGDHRQRHVHRQQLRIRRYGSVAPPTVAVQNPSPLFYYFSFVYLFLFIRTGGVKTSANPHAPPPLCHLHW